MYSAYVYNFSWDCLDFEKNTSNKEAIDLNFILVYVKYCFSCRLATGV